MTKLQQICPTLVQLKSLEVAVGREGVIAHNVTLGAYNNYKFLEFI